MPTFDPKIVEFINSLQIELLCNEERCVDIAILKLAVNPSNPELYEFYKTYIDKHNYSMLHDPYPNAGFDLFTPHDFIFNERYASKFINLEVKAEMISIYAKSDSSENCGFYIYPRSSISKTPLMLSNHTGIIDSGYRGDLIAAFRCFSDSYIVEKESRLLQICHPSLSRILVCLVDETELSSTLRGNGGFGSTGK